MDKLLEKFKDMDPDEKAKLIKALKEEEGDDRKMGWMYKADEPDREEYLLGRRIDKHIENKDKVEENPDAPGASFQEVLARRADFDMHAKMREDPLFAIRKKEEEAKKRLLQNPIKMKQLEKLMKEREKKLKKNKKKKKKKHRAPSDSDSDDDIVNKYLAILEQKKYGKGEKQGKSDQSHEGSRSHDQDNPDRRHKHSGTEPARHRHNSEEERHSQYSKSYGLLLRGETSTKTSNDSHRLKNSSRSEEKFHQKSRDRSRERSPGRSHKSSTQRSRSPVQSSSSRSKKRSSSPPPKDKKKKLSQDEMDRRRAEMLENANWRDEQREHNVKRYRDEEAREAKQHEQKGSKAEFLNPMMMKHADTSTVEDRIKRNMYNVQRTKSDLDKNFARR